MLGFRSLRARAARAVRHDPRRTVGVTWLATPKLPATGTGRALAPPPPGGGVTQPPGGIPAAPAKATWSGAADAPYNGPIGSPISYQHPANWTVTQHVTGPAVTYVRQLVRWTMNVEDARIRYMYGYTGTSSEW